MKIKNLALAGLVGVSTMMSGCIVAAVAVGAGTVAYIDGKYTMNVKGNVETVYAAALKAVKSNTNYVIVSKTQAEKSAEIDASTKVSNTDFSVKVEKQSEDASKVVIKFGTFGDQQESAELMDKINANLK